MHKTPFFRFLSLAAILAGCPGPVPSYADGPEGSGGASAGGAGASSTGGLGESGSGAAGGDAIGGGGGAGGCPSDSYGPSCTPCDCQNGATCDSGETGTGACTCMPGNFGPSCSGVCACAGQICLDGAQGDGSCIAAATCAEILDAIPAATDGDYVLHHDNDSSKPWDAYCHAMATSPVEYLPLNNLNVFEDHSVNYLNPQYMTFSRVRIDPITLAVNVTDLTFAVRSGETSGPDLPYATACSCKANHGNGELGQGKIDLQGTPFYVADSFDNFGYCSSTPIALFSQDDQVVDLVGDGQCGCTGPISRAAFFGDACWNILPDPSQDPVWSLHLAFLP